MLMINNQPMEWNGYEFGIRFTNGEVVAKRDAKAASGAKHQLETVGVAVAVVCRAHYVEKWHQVES